MRRIENLLQNQREIFYLYILHFLNDGYLTTLSIFLPFISKKLNINLFQVGLLMGILNLSGIIMPLPAAYVAKKIKGIRLLFVGMLLYGISYFFIGLSNTYFLLLISFLLIGIGFGLFHSVAFALVGKFSSSKNIGRNMGIFTSVGEGGRIILVSLASFSITLIGIKFTSILYGLVPIIFFFSLFKIKLSKIKKGISIFKLKKIKIDFSYFNFLKAKGFILINITNIFDAFSNASFFIFLPFLLLQKKIITPSIIGIILSLFLVGSLIGKTLLGKMGDKFSHKKIFIFSQGMMALSIIYLIKSESLFFIVFFSFFSGLFTKGTIPVLKAMLGQSIKNKKRYEAIFSINILISYIGVTLSPIFFGFLAHKYNIIVSFQGISFFALIAIFPILFYKE